MHEPRISRAALLVTGLQLLVGCATLQVHDAEPGRAPRGVRIYPPKVYLLVDSCAKKSRLVYAPDYANAYDVRPLTIFARQDFDVELDEGQMTKLTSNQDTTAFLTFFQGAAQMAAKTAGVAVSGTAVDGTFGLHDGVWTIDETGRLESVRVVESRKCP